jgi:hypothetical protein
MKVIPAERRLPALGLAACVAMMPLLCYGLPYLVFELLGRPLILVQYLTFVAVFCCQWVLYVCGIIFLLVLHQDCPRPATRFGAWVMGICGGMFVVIGGAWCAFCAFMFFIMTTSPW